MNNDTDEVSISTFLYIIEEYLLLGFVSLQEYPSVIQIICNKYEYSNSLENEDSFGIKTACLNLSTSMLLRVYEEKNLENLKCFEVHKIHI